MLNSYIDAGLDVLIAEADSVVQDTSAAFGKLTPEQLNWKPNPEKWSVGQCFEHLMITNGPYIPIFEGLLKGEIKKSFAQRLPFLPGILGKLVINAVSPATTRKIKARADFSPASSSVKPDIIDSFLDQQQKLFTLIRAAGKLPLDKIIITSPILSIVTYSALNAVRIVTAHERRHFLQAKRVTEENGYPHS